MKLFSDENWRLLYSAFTDQMRALIPFMTMMERESLLSEFINICETSNPNPEFGVNPLFTKEDLYVSKQDISNHVNEYERNCLSF